MNCKFRNIFPVFIGLFLFVCSYGHSGERFLTVTGKVVGLHKSPMKNVEVSIVVGRNDRYEDGVKKIEGDSFISKTKTNSEGAYNIQVPVTNNNTFVMFVKKHPCDMPFFKFDKEYAEFLKGSRDNIEQNVSMNCLSNDELPDVADAPEKGSYGIYSQVLVGSGFALTYIVDTVAQQCYAGGGQTVIPCESLVKRSEWRPIINWTNKK